MMLRLTLSGLTDRLGSSPAPDSAHSFPLTPVTPTPAAPPPVTCPLPTPAPPPNPPLPAPKLPPPAETPIPTDPESLLMRINFS